MQTRLSKKNIDRFLELLDHLEFYNVTEEERFAFIIVCSAEPDIVEYAEQMKVKILWSYEF